MHIREKDNIIILSLVYNSIPETIKMVKNDEEWNVKIVGGTCLRVCFWHSRIDEMAWDLKREE